MGDVTMLKKSAAIYIMVFCLIFAFSCKEAKKDTETFVLSDTELLLDLFDEAVIDVSGAGEGLIGWKSLDLSVASVENGRVTAKGEGETVIVAKLGKCEKKCAVKVFYSGLLPVIRCNYDSVELRAGDSLSLFYGIRYKGKTIKGDIKLTSNDMTVAEIKDGVLKGLKAGSTVIVARCFLNGREIYNSLRVTVC